MVLFNIRCKKNIYSEHKKLLHFNKYEIKML